MEKLTVKDLYELIIAADSQDDDVPSMPVTVMQYLILYAMSLAVTEFANNMWPNGKHNYACYGMHAEIGSLVIALI